MNATFVRSIRVLRARRSGTVRMTSRRLSYILQQQVHLYTPEANQLREQIDRYVEAERQIEGEMARRVIRA